ncbi:MAG: acyl-CoA thioesterase [Bacteriovoracaceae bacterium]|nr:acyl-CoA thioesterase [Bacteriovoracaceae bacterium]
MEVHEYKFKVLESHLDTFGHINNATYLQLFEEARWDLITERGWGLKEVQAREIGPVILELNLKFKREIKNREIITVVSQSGDMLNKLVMTMHQKMIKENGDVAAILDIHVGLMDLKARKLIEPTSEWLAAVGYK